MSKCIKCGGEDISVRYVEARKPYNEVVPEHLAKKCKTCEYKWTTECNDHPDMLKIGGSR